MFQVFGWAFMATLGAVGAVLFLVLLWAGLRVLVLAVVSGGESFAHWRYVRRERARNREAIRAYNRSQGRM